MQVIRLYFAGPDDGGHGYTLGRVPINSCDFSPGSYSFDDVSGDTELEHFDTSVQHDVDVGMIPMMLDAKATFDGLIERLAPDVKTRDEILANRIYQELSDGMLGYNHARKFTDKVPFP